MAKQELKNQLEQYLSERYRAFRFSIPLSNIIGPTRRTQKVKAFREVLGDQLFSDYTNEWREARRGLKERVFRKYGKIYLNKLSRQKQIFKKYIHKHIQNKKGFDNWTIIVPRNDSAEVLLKPKNGDMLPIPENLSPERRKYYPIEVLQSLISSIKRDSIIPIINHIKPENRDIDLACSVRIIGNFVVESENGTLLNKHCQTKPTVISLRSSTNFTKAIQTLREQWNGSWKRFIAGHEIGAERIRLSQIGENILEDREEVAFENPEIEMNNGDVIKEGEYEWNLIGIKNFAITFQFLYRDNNPNDVANVMIAGNDVRYINGVLDGTFTEEQINQN